MIHRDYKESIKRYHDSTYKDFDLDTLEEDIYQDSLQSEDLRFQLSILTHRLDFNNLLPNSRTYSFVYSIEEYFETMGTIIVRKLQISDILKGSMGGYIDNKRPNIPRIQLLFYLAAKKQEIEARYDRQINENDLKEIRDGINNLLSDLQENYAKIAGNYYQLKYFFMD